MALTNHGKQMFLVISRCFASSNSIFLWLLYKYIFLTKVNINFNLSSKVKLFHPKCTLSLNSNSRYTISSTQNTPNLTLPCLLKLCLSFTLFFFVFKQIFDFFCYTVFHGNWLKIAEFLAFSWP